jgi:beta-lactamase class A
MTKFKINHKLIKKIKKVISDLKLDKEFSISDKTKKHISLCILDLSSEIPKIAGYKMYNFLYPASLYKIYIAGALMEQVSKKKLFLDKKYKVKKVNAIDKKKEVSIDARQLIKAGQSVSLDYLLDLMITRSDNTAANCLIDIIDRKEINKFIHKHGWKGSEVTRKFLPRELEDKKYKDAKPTLTNALHVAEFFYLLEEGKIGNKDLSIYLKGVFGRQLDNTKLSKGFSKKSNFHHKTGWFAYGKKNKYGFTADAGILEMNDKKYIVSVIIPVSPLKGNKILKNLGTKLFH